jgi:predicted dehydrogenase
MSASPVPQRGAFTKHGLDVKEPAMAAGGVPGSPGWGEEPPERWGLLGEDGDARPVATDPGCYLAFYDAFAAAIRGDGPVPVDPADAVAGLEVIAAARASAQRGEVVRLATAIAQDRGEAR